MMCGSYFRIAEQSFADLMLATLEVEVLFNWTNIPRQQPLLRSAGIDPNAFARALKSTSVASPSSTAANSFKCRLKSAAASCSSSNHFPISYSVNSLDFSFVRSFSIILLTSSWDRPRSNSVFSLM
jgi:hypothetical protein